MTPERLQELKQFYTHDAAIGECVEEIERIRRCLLERDAQLHASHEGESRSWKQFDQLERELADTRAELEMAKAALAMNARLKGGAR